MSILRRVRDMTVATLNEMLEQAEDPVRLIDRYLHELREQIQEAEKIYGQVISHAQSLRTQYLVALEQKEKREQQALLALKAGEEEIARLALQEKIGFEERSTQYKGLYEQSKAQIIELEDQIKQLRSDYQEVYDKRAFYQARIESVRLQQRMNERLGGFSGGHTVTRTFGRLDERLSDLEIEAKSLRDIRRMGREALYSAGTAAQQMLEQELSQLRQKLEQEGWSKR